MPRPKKPSRAYGIRLPVELHERLVRSAEERDVSTNWLMVKAISEFLDRLIPIEEFSLTRDRRSNHDRERTSL